MQPQRPPAHNPYAFPRQADKQPSPSPPSPQHLQYNAAHFQDIRPSQRPPTQHVSPSPSTQFSPPHSPYAMPSQQYQHAQQQRLQAGKSDGQHPYILENQPLFNAGVVYGTQIFNAGQGMVQEKVSRFIPAGLLKSYFNVTNGYVIKKIGLILFPFRNKMWQRTVNRSGVTGEMEGFKPPRDDLNSPDLYIPIMALVTYVLLVGVMMGIRGTFTPAMLGGTTSTALIFILMELGIVKLGCFLLSLSDVGMLDILAIIGYNFVGLIFTLLMTLVFGSMGKNMSFIYVSIAMGFFLLRTLRHSFLPDTASALVVTQRRRRIHFLFVIAALQILLSYFLLV